MRGPKQALQTVLVECGRPGRGGEVSDDLREAHGLIKAITDNATTAIFMMDGDGATTFMNPAAEAMVAD